MSPNTALPIDEIDSESDPFPTPTAAQLLEQEVAVRAAMVKSMENLTLDEQYIVGQMISTLRERHEELIAMPHFGLEIVLSIAAFARRCLVNIDEASTRLGNAARALYERNIRARYPSAKGKGLMKHSICWFESIDVHHDEITLRLSAEAMRRLLVSLAVAAEQVEESESMVGQLLAGSEIVGAVLVRRATPIGERATNANRQDRMPPLIVRGERVA